MRLIKESKFNRVIGENFEQSFKVEKDSLYLLEISARCKNWLQNWGNLFDDDDLSVYLDGRDLSGVRGRRAFEKPKAGWNGNQLKNLNQINVFVLRLKAGEHTLNFKPDREPKLESLRIYEISNPSKVELVPQSSYKQAEDGNRRPWYTFALIDLALESLAISAKAYSGRQHTFFQSDDDDLQVKINGQRQRNDTPKSHSYWFWCGKILQGESRTFEKNLNFSSGTYYIELLADRTPTLEKVIFNLKGILPVGKVKLYKDVTSLNRVHLWKEASAKSEILAEVLDGDAVEIIEERVRGSYVPNESNIWHKVNYEDQTGYILSSFVEIAGQERDVVIGKIRQKAAELGVDVNNMLALAGCESQYKPYAVSEVGARGIFQLTQDAINQLKNLDFDVDDPFDINQNIEGGIRYFRWLLETFYKDVPHSLEKTVAAYNWGQGRVPPNDPLNPDNLPKDTAWLVTCVLKNKKRRDWKQIFLPLLIFLLGFAVGNAYAYLNWIDFFEPTVPEVLSAVDVQQRNCPEVLRGDNDKEIILVNNLCHTIRIFGDQELGLEVSDRWDSLRGGDQLIQTGNLFYFLATSSLRCGMQNCTYNLYGYDEELDSLRLIATDIFGAGVRLDISPDGRKMAIITTAHASVCHENSYLDLLDIASKEKQTIDRFRDPQLGITHIEGLKWLSDQKLEILTSHSAGCDPAEHTIRRKRFLLDLETDKIEQELLEERELIL
jgi:hypothetical protein